MESQSESPNLEADMNKLSVQNGEKSVVGKENMPPTAIQDENKPVDEGVKNMTQAAPTPQHDDDDDAGGDDDDTHSVATSTMSTTTAGGTKKKKKRKPKSKRGIGKPTGFEEYFAEGPLTPAQHARDLEDYSPDLPFIDRILRAMQRFEQTKRMDPQRRDIFYKYLAYGGIEVGPNMFQGSMDVEGHDKDFMNIAASQAAVGKDKYNIHTPEAKYAVDFTGCVSGFLSRRAMFYYGFETRELVELVTSVLEKFMTYLLHHSVCPEYEADIKEARKIIQKSRTELYNIAQIANWLPGDFNVAASTLFGGTYSTRYDGISSWDPLDVDPAHQQPSFIGFTRETAHQIFGLAIATVGTEQQYEDFIAGPPSSTNKAYEVIETKERAGFEITEIIAVTEQNLAFYKQTTKEFRPVGIVHARPWHNKASDGLKDRTPAERAAAAAESAQQSQSLTLFHCTSSSPDDDPLATTPPSWTFTSPSTSTSTGTSTYTIFIEGSIQQFLFVRMKLEATLHKLRCGIWFMDDFLQAFCSFDTWLCNELMVGWKEPRIKRGAVCFHGEGMGEEEDEQWGQGEPEDEEENDGGGGSGGGGAAAAGRGIE